MLRTILAPNPSPMTLGGTHTYLVGKTRPVVIDPGPADPDHLCRIEEALAGAHPAAILLTHGHADHSRGAAHLAKCIGAPVWMAAGALRLPWEAEVVGRWLVEGDEVESDAGVIQAVATPGHAPEHLAFLWEGGEARERGALFVGDLMMGEGDTTLVAPPEGDLSAYLRSLERVHQLDPEVLYPAHGPPLQDPRAAVARYLSHRRERIEQVYDAVRAHPGAEAAEWVQAVYGTDLHPTLAAAAKGSLEAVLRYLEAQGRIRRRGEGYTPRN